LHRNKQKYKSEKEKNFIFIIQKIKNKSRKHINIKNKKDKKVKKKKLKHEPNIVEITHLCIRHGVQTSILYEMRSMTNFMTSIETSS
jgi:hypothetical protein